MVLPPKLPCHLPTADRLPGNRVDLERTDPDRHGSGLWQAIGRHPDLWWAIPAGPFESPGAFLDWLTERAQRPGIVLYTIMDRASATPAGLFFVLRGNPDMGVIEMGLMYGPALARRAAGTEAFLLLAGHLFEALGYRRLEWCCNTENAASRRAAERYGFTLEGVARQAMWTKGANCDTAIYSLLDREWPDVARRLRAWLSPDNFAPDGEQRRSLRDLA